jgi:hypothetical protein
MKRFPLNIPSTIIFSIKLGPCLGVIASIYLFEVKVDIPAIPSVKKGVRTNQDITLEQDGIYLRLSRGSQFRLDPHSPSGNIYAIYFHIPLTDPIGASFETLPFKAKDFEVKSQE